MLRATSRSTRNPRSAWFLNSDEASRPTFTPYPFAKTHFFLPTLARLAEVYEIVFPGASELSEPLKINDPHTIHDLIYCFLERMKNEYFPVETEMLWEDFDSLHPALQGTIPVKPLGFDIWGDYEEEPIRLVVRLADVEHNPAERLADFEEEYPSYSLPIPFPFSSLPEVLEQMNFVSPLKYLPDLIRIAAGTTDTFFLDCCPANFEFFQSYRGGGGFWWSEENIIWLKEEWARAKPIYDRAWMLIRWVRQDTSRVEVLMETMLKAYEYKKVTS